MAKKVTAKACKARGKKLVHIKSRSFCAGGKKKGKKGGKKGFAKMSVAARKAATRKGCAKKKSPAKQKAMAGLCKWARS